MVIPVICFSSKAAMLSVIVLSVVMPNVMATGSVGNHMLGFLLQIRQNTHQ